MTKEEAAESLIQSYDIVLDLERSVFNDGSYTVSIANVFDSKGEALEFILAIKTLCNKN